MGSDDSLNDTRLRVGRRRLAVREFLQALGSGFTYNPLRNVHAVFGFLWGLPIPLFSVGIDVMVADRPLTPAGCWAAIREHPVHWMFALHPVLFAVVFGAMGTVRLRQDERIGRLIDDLAAKVRALAEANDRLKDLDRLKSQFLANVSHELKTPLVCLYGYTDMIVQGRLGTVTGPQQEALVVMARNAERLLRLIEELLDFGRLEAGRMRVIRMPFDLAEVVRVAAQSLEPIFREKQLGVVLNGAQRPVLALGDRERILRVLINLLSNACKFSPRGKPVGIRLVTAVNSVEVVVWDEGVGLTEDEQSHMFERFWQAEPAAHRPGSGAGLGLAIVKEILDRHGSTIRVWSEKGRGTRFQFELPLAIMEAESPPPSSPPPSVPAGKSA